MLLYTHHFIHFMPGHGPPGNKAVKAMKYTVKELTRFNLTEVVNGDRIISIDTMRNTIAASAPGNLYPTMKLTFNKCDVLRLNKTSVSTCNIEFLIYALANDQNTFNNVYSFIKYHTVIYNAKNINEHAKISKAGFYNAFNKNEETIKEFVNFFKTWCSSETRQQIIYDHICFNHEAKMNGIISLSTYIGNNIFCQARCNNCNNAICKYCYAASLTNQRQYLKNKLIRIHAILTNVNLSVLDIPHIDSELYPYFRFCAFGDINNVLHVQNINLIASVNPEVNFTLWTKNPGIIQAAINNGLQLADNLIIGLSSLYINKPDLHIAHKYDFIRFLFTVYDHDYAAKHDIKINCGAKHCLTCGICYDYLHKFLHGLQLINELLK